MIYCGKWFQCDKGPRFMCTRNPDHDGKHWATVKGTMYRQAPGLPEADHHPKWQRVEPGTVIPAGQPYAIHHTNGVMRWSEHLNPSYSTRTYGDPAIKGWFVDSSWKPPLVLPTEPTWGIAFYEVDHQRPWIGLFYQDDKLFRDVRSGGCIGVHAMRNFIPLTDEQVARIEAAR